MSGSTPVEMKILLRCIAAKEQQRIAVEKKAIAEKQQRIAAEKINSINEAINAVHVVLSAAALISQAEVILSTSTFDNNASHRAKVRKYVDYVTPKEDCDALPSQGPPHCVTSLFRNAKKFDDTSPFHRNSLNSFALGKGIQDV